MARKYLLKDCHMLKKIERFKLKNPTVAAVVVIATLLPFLKKAYFQDSYIYLKPAEYILQKPLDPYGISLGCRGDLFFKETHPPLTSYILASVAYFGNLNSEWEVNLIYILLAGLTAACVYLLSKEYIKNGLLASLLACISPSFLICFSQVNADPITLFFWILTLALLFEAVRTRHMATFLLSGISAGFASLSSFQSLMLLPLCTFYLILKKVKIDKILYFLLAALGIFSLWCVENLFYYGKLQLLNASGAGEVKIGLHLIGNKLISAFSIIGGAGVFPFLYIYFFYKIKNWLRIFFIITAITFLFVFYSKFEDIALYSIHQKILLSFFLACGITATTLMLKELAMLLFGHGPHASKSENALFLLWFWGVIIYNILLMPFESARYLLPAFVPLVIVLIRKIEEAGAVVDYKQPVVAAICLNSILCVGLLYSDYKHADIYRDLASKIKIGKLNNKKVYFDGNWGFWYYMERQGAIRAYNYGNTIADGNLFVRPIYSSPKPLERDFDSHLNLLKSKTYNESFPLRLLSKPSQAGFYSQVWGFLPYSFSREPLDTFSIYQYREEGNAQIDAEENVGEVYANRTVEMKFQPGSNSMSGMGFFAATYMRKNSGHVFFELKNSEGTLIAKQVLPLSGVRDNAWIAINFPRISVTPQETLTVTLFSPDSSPGNSITVYYKKTSPGVSVTVDNKSLNGALAFVVYK